MNKKKNTTQFASNTVQVTYEQSVIARALARAGSNPNIKGHIHEILIQDKSNLKNLINMNGATTKLTQNPTAKVVDLVTTKGGKVIERIQAKDIQSTTGIHKLIQQCQDGKYRSARLIGTEETVEAFNKAAEKAGIAKRMSSSGISSKTTETLAQRTGNTLGSCSRAMMQSAKLGGTTGAVISAGISTIKGVVDIAKGEADVEDVVKDVAVNTIKGGVSGAASSAAATATAMGIAAMGITGGAIVTAITVAAPVVAAVTVGSMVCKAVDAIFEFFN